jgi:hypothetical protein
MSRPWTRSTHSSSGSASIHVALALGACVLVSASLHTAASRRLMLASSMAWRTEAISAAQVCASLAARSRAADPLHYTVPASYGLPARTGKVLGNRGSRNRARLPAPGRWALHRCHPCRLAESYGVGWPRSGHSGNPEVVRARAASGDWNTPVFDLLRR